MKIANLGIFGRTYGILVATVLIAELLIFVLFIAAGPASAPLTRVKDVASALREGHVPPGTDLTLRVMDRPPNPENSRMAMRVANLIGKAARIPADQLTVSMSRPFRHRDRPSEIAGRPPLAMPNDVIPGNFTVSRKSGVQWLSVSNNGQFFAEFVRRVGLILLITLATVLPCAFWLARQTARPFQRFALVADQVGRNPEIRTETWTGPLEVQLAGESLNLMQQRIAAQIQSRTTLLTAIAHDLRTPLMRMMLHSERFPIEERQQVVAQIREMQAIIESTLDYVGDGRRQGADQVFDAGEVLSALCSRAASAGLPVKCKQPKGMMLIAGEPLALERALHNLIENAVKYGNVAHCSVSREVDAIVFRIRDEGPGIPANDLDKVFEPFVRVESSRNSETGGTGLGLAIVRGIARSHQGDVRLVNGVSGLVAEFRLPVSRTGV